MELQRIVLDHVHPAYIEKHKIRDSQLWDQKVVFEKGETYFVIAPSGKGKSSFIHFLYLLRNDYNGSLQIDEKAAKQLKDDEISEIRKAKMSIVFQDLRLFKRQTLRENIEIKRVLQPFYEADEILEMAERLGIASRLDMAAEKCSFGEQQRAAIIRALMQPYDFILLDEPFSHLDKANALKALQLIEEESAKRGAATIIAGLDEEEFSSGGKILIM